MHAASYVRSLFGFVVFVGISVSSQAIGAQSPLPGGDSIALRSVVVPKRNTTVSRIYIGVIDTAIGGACVIHL